MPAVLAPPASTIVTLSGPRWDDASQEPTPASVWRAAAGTTIVDELLEWPPDLFALTEVILQRSEAYRFALSPPVGSTWPPADIPDWPDAVTDTARRWSAWSEDRNGAIPRLLAQEWGIARARAGIPLSQLAEGRDWRLCEALLTLHAIADEACAGLGVALDASGADGLVYRARGRELLARTGSLARIPAHLIRVLPKVRTPPNGSSLRSLSRYAAVQVPGVATRWHKAPARRLGRQPYGRGVNFLLLPWPLRVRGSDFRPIAGPLQKLANDPFGFFEFAPADRLDLDLVDRTLVAARDEVETVNVVILPESAVEHGEIDDLEAVLARHGVTGLISGVREHSAHPGQFSRNWVHIGVSTGEHWVHIRQSKHHRWSLDEAQICQYQLGGALHPHIRWWEAMQIPRRSVEFVELGDGITLAALVCEDLAQTDDVASVIRSVGPMIVVTPLLDGPRLSGPDADVIWHGAALPAARTGLLARGRAMERPRPADTRDPARARCPRHRAICERRPCGQAQLRWPSARRERQRILRREHPPGQGLKHRLGVTGPAGLPTRPARAGRRRTHDPDILGGSGGRRAGVRAP